MRQKTITIGKVKLGILEARGKRVMMAGQIAELHGISNNFSLNTFAKFKEKFTGADTFMLTKDEVIDMKLGKGNYSRPMRAFTKSGYLTLLSLSKIKDPNGVVYFDDEEDNPKRIFDAENIDAWDMEKHKDGETSFQPTAHEDEDQEPAPIIDEPRPGVQLPPPVVTAKKRLVDDEILEFAENIVRMRDRLSQNQEAFISIRKRVAALLEFIDREAAA